MAAISDVLRTRTLLVDDHTAVAGSPTPTRQRANPWLLLGLGGFLMWTVFRFAWISDDALITGRTVLNFVNGYGANFNVNEHVQAYTHPLWFAIWSAISLVTGEVILTPIFMGLLFTAVAVFIVARVATDNVRAVVALVGLAISPTFVEWSTSGLENSLAMALVGSLWVIDPRRGRSRLIVWGLLLAALALTRYDLAVLALPIAALRVFQLKSWRDRIILLAVSVLPFAAWLLVSRAYYGYWFPATFYAKTNLQIPRHELIFQGLRYITVWVTTEPQSAVVLALGVVSLLVKRTFTAVAWVGGIALYLAYVVWVGGDFMSGRFFTVPLYVAALGIASALPMQFVAARDRLVATVLLIGALLLVASPWNPVLQSERAGPRWDYTKNGGIADERGFYVGGRNYGLMQWIMDRRGNPDSPGIGRLRRQAAANWGRPLGTAGVPQADRAPSLCDGLGTNGIELGPDVSPIDVCGLNDMYVARTPYVASAYDWRIGHFDRQLPDGYQQSVLSGQNQVVDRDEAKRLNEVWKRIHHRPLPAER